METVKTMPAITANDAKIMNNTETSLMKERKKERRIYSAKQLFVFMLAIVSAFALTAVAVFAGPSRGGDVNSAGEAVNNVGKIIKNIVIAFGTIMALLGIYFLGRSFSSHDPAQRTQGIELIAGGALMDGASLILGAIIKNNVLG